MNLLVIGANDTGKTHFVGQLYGRLQKGGTRLRLRAAPSNLSALEEVLERLNEGKTASHTSADVYHEIDMPLLTEAGETFNLLFPDYGGEQIRNIVAQRATTDDWIVRLRQSQGWLFLIRLSLVSRPEDLLSRPPGHSLAFSPVPEPDDVQSKGQGRATNYLSATTFIELLQALLSFTEQGGSITKRRSPVLAIILSCWDEVKKTEASETTTPFEVLRQKMPMLAEFLTAHWEETRLLVYGLSALEKPLSDSISDEAYLDQGPESFGYVIMPNGNSDKDLTVPISELLKLINDADKRFSGNLRRC